MLIDFLTKASDAVLKRSEECINQLRESVNNYINRYGAGWEDIIIGFEWQDELNRMRMSDLPEAVKSNIDRII